MPEEADEFSGPEDFPIELMDTSKLELVIAFLRAMPLPLSSKKRKLYFWGKSLGVLVDPSDYRRLEPGGIS